MRKFLGISFSLLLAAGITGFAAEPAAKTTGVTQEIYGGWMDGLTLRGGDTKAVIVPAVGGRVLSYALNGENILFDNAEAGRLSVLNPASFFSGGYQLDVGPELRGLPSHPWLWQGPWGWRAPRPLTVQVFSDSELTVGVQLEKEFVMDPDTGELGVTQQMRNVVSNDVSFCLWDRTVCKGGGFVILPLNSRSRFKAGWAIRQGSKVAEYRYEGDKPADARVRVLDRVLVAQARALPDAPELKLGADSDAGWIAYARGKVLLVKYFPVFPGANYSDGGNTVEFYCNDRMAELEPLSPEVTLKPGGTYGFPEKWTLLELDREVKTHEQARALVKKIPRSPFVK
jgi:hypothetical protein